MNLYGDLLRNGWTMTDIDNMDIYYYLEVMINEVNKKNKKEEKYIDELTWL